MVMVVVLKKFHVRVLKTGAASQLTILDVLTNQMEKLGSSTVVEQLATVMTI